MAGPARYAKDHSVRVRFTILTSMFTSAANSDSAPEPTWRDLYLLALLEADRVKLNERITAAENALIDRISDLSEDPNSIAEREAIGNALHTITALRSCLGLRPAAIAA